MSWKGYDPEGKGASAASEKKSGGAKKTAAGKKAGKFAMKVKKSALKTKAPARKTTGDFSPTAVIKCLATGSDYMAKRCKKANGKTVDSVVNKMTYTDAKGNSRNYGVSDLKYDISSGRINLKK